MSYQLAHLNIAQMRYAWDAPEMETFNEQLDPINALADAADGFVWRLDDDSESSAFSDDTLVNLSVWQDVESLRRYAFESAHVDVMRRRADWFDRMAQASTVLWWIPAGTIPTEQEAKERLTVIQEKGATGEAFNFGKPFPPPED